MTDAKEWVTIKIPKSVRDEAQKDNRTYGRIMKAGLEKDMFASNDDLAEGVEHRLDDVEQSLSSRLDDLQAQLPKDVAEELSR